MLLTRVEQMDGKWLVGATDSVCGRWLVIVGILTILTCSGCSDISSSAIGNMDASCFCMILKCYKNNNRNIMYAIS